jgi:8-oxo-dGTP pyrophosphatase MutT (NUDIX family)
MPVSACPEERSSVTWRRDRHWIETRFQSRRMIPTQVMMPDDVWRARGDHDLNAGMDPIRPLKPAAVLVPLIERPDELTVLFTQRTSHLAHHAGQVSFPGGHIEPGDGGPAETALRETEEEVGVDRGHVRLVGHLDTYVTRTGFVVAPVVGVITPPFTLRPDPHEVAEVFEVPLSFLLDRQNHHRCSAEFEGTSRHFWAMPFGRHFIWGATAGMVVNMCDILDSQ